MFGMILQEGSIKKIYRVSRDKERVIVRKDSFCLAFPWSNKHPMMVRKYAVNIRVRRLGTMVLKTHTLVMKASCNSMKTANAHDPTTRYAHM